jgi:SAM-dependent methyltransferase
MTSGTTDRWSSGGAYESYIGRWSRLVAPRFLHWIAVPAGARWLDVGCGTGALTEAILAAADPASVVGIDPSDAFVEHARATVVDPSARFASGTASETGVDVGAVDAVVSGLVLNFLPDLAAALAEARRIAVPGGVVAGYVWDYARGMELLRRFWDAAVELDPAAAALDEGLRFPGAAAGPLEAAFVGAGFDAVEVQAIDVPTSFGTYDELWTPFLSGTGPAPAYVASLPEAGKLALRGRLRASVAEGADGSIALVARAWAVKGTTPAT